MQFDVIGLWSHTIYWRIVMNAHRACVFIPIDRFIDKWNLLKVQITQSNYSRRRLVIVAQFVWNSVALGGLVSVNIVTNTVL